MTLNLDLLLTDSYLDQTLLSVAEKAGLYLKNFANDEEFVTKMRLAFGETLETGVILNLGNAWKNEDFSIVPTITILSSAELHGANAAYAVATNTIYLSREFVNNNQDSLVDVFLEELGHRIDALLNKIDSAGDEGAIFTALVKGEDLSSEQLQKLKEENDSNIIIVDGQSVQVEQALVTLLQLFNPVGIAIDKQGNLIASNSDNSGPLIKKISSTGTIIQQIRSGAFPEDGGYLAVVPSSGDIWRLQTNGNLSIINPNNLSVTNIGNVKDLNVNVNSIFDIVTGTTRDLGGLILPQAGQTYYGDIALLERGNQLDVFVSGLSVGTFPFVMRLRFQGNTLDARVVIASTGTTVSGLGQTGGNVNLTRGIAVNNQGIVLTTLPINSSLVFYDVPVSFSADFPEKGGTPQVKLKGYNKDTTYTDISSQGMTTDNNGNFYVVTNSVGSRSLNASGGGAVIVLDPDINNVLAVQAPSSNLSSFRDIVVNSSNKVAYVTSSENSISPFSIGNNINTTITLTNVKQNPALYMNQIRDYDGNDVGSGSSWRLLGDVDVQGDRDSESVFVNPLIGRWATVGAVNDLVDFSKYGQGGDTRVVGIYIDPTLKNQPQNIGGPFDSQRRFQNDLRIDNLNLLAAADYNKDGFQDMYFKLGDGTAVLRALMHLDGNIQYANYQSKADLTTFMTANNVSSSIWGGWL
jgi:hypothetical protein